MNIHSDAPGRDPVAIAIETLLVEMQMKGMGSIYKKITPLGVQLTFDGVMAEGETLDLALVRLANAMLDKGKYSPLLIETLKPLKSEAA